MWDLSKTWKYSKASWGIVLCFVMLSKGKLAQALLSTGTPAVWQSESKSMILVLVDTSFFLQAAYPISQRWLTPAAQDYQLWIRSLICWPKRLASPRALTSYWQSWRPVSCVMVPPPGLPSWLLPIFFFFFFPPFGYVNIKELENIIL